MSSFLDWIDNESNVSGLNWLGVLIGFLIRLSGDEAVGEGVDCAKTQSGKHKKRNIRSTLKRFVKGIDFENNSYLAFKRFLLY